MSDWEADEGEHWATNAERYTRMLAGFGDIVSSAASFALGERVLEVGCGNGDVVLPAARAVGATGSVHGVDLSPAMLTVAALVPYESPSGVELGGAAWLVTAST